MDVTHASLTEDYCFLDGLQVTNQSSEIADDRPSAACEFAPGGGTLATGAWSGLVKLWSVPACQKQLTIKAHDDRVTGEHTPFSQRQP